jgi:hypothetical protein
MLLLNVNKARFKIIGTLIHTDIKKDGAKVKLIYS